MMWKITSSELLKHYTKSSVIFGFYVVKNGAKYIVRNNSARML